MAEIRHVWFVEAKMDDRDSWSPYRDHRYTRNEADRYRASLEIAHPSWKFRVRKYVRGER